MAEQSFDLIVLGGGPGGYVAAIRAAQLKMKVALVEREHLGGICLNWGCIPTKALLRSSEINHLLHTLDQYGFAADNIRFDFAKVIKRSRQVAGQLSAGVKGLLRKNKVTVFDGQGEARREGEAGGDEGRQAGRRPGRAAHHPGHRRPRPRAARHRARRQADLDLQGGAGAAGHAEAADRHRIGRHRQRVRELLPQHGRRGHADRGDGPRAARGGRRDLRLRAQEPSRSRA